MENNLLNKPSETPVFAYSNTRLLIFVILIALYLVAWRPGRAMLTQELVIPAVERITETNPDTHYLSSQQKSVTFTVYVLKDDVSLDPQQSDSWQSNVFSFPWGFYLFFPLLFFCFVKYYKPFIKFHLVFQLTAGLICITAFILALNIHDSLFHIYRMLTYYIVPGFAFIIVFAALFQKKLVLR